MTIINQRKVQLTAIGWMLLGSAAIFLVVLGMNHFGEQKQVEEKQYSASFEVKRPEKPPARKEKVQKRIKPKSSITPPLMLDLSSGLAGLDLGLPAFAVGDMADDSLLGDTSNAVMTDDMVDTAARAVSRAPVEYPRRARAKDIEGYVVISLLIDKKGRVARAKVIESEPTGIFEEKALQTVKTWIFEPARYKGKAVDSWANQTIRFELS